MGYYSRYKSIIWERKSSIRSSDEKTIVAVDYMGIDRNKLESIYQKNLQKLAVKSISGNRFSLTCETDDVTKYILILR